MYLYYICQIPPLRKTVRYSVKKSVLLAKHTLIKLIILPILDFGDVIYKIASNTLLSKLDVVYHSAIHFVTKAPYTTHHCHL
jgi:hypothetical protein